eukprot:TRINITY_DN16983_c0_g1_i3.p7 TRINITY_DN16983_c0_g1~~TRINITY_DN16983_c0_g1_i3.p7  ORF type:complete len:148 (-),score=2.89 TRINITY_DN16983_c0_g1_i3:1675-2118(-)
MMIYDMMGCAKSKFHMYLVEIRKTQENTENKKGTGSLWHMILYYVVQVGGMHTSTNIPTYLKYQVGANQICMHMRQDKKIERLLKFMMSEIYTLALYTLQYVHMIIDDIVYKRVFGRCIYSGILWHFLLIAVTNRQKGRKEGGILWQ